MQYETLEQRLMLAGDTPSGMTCCCPVCMGVMDETPVVASSPIVPLSNTFTLNSLPGANHTIYLDFNGHVTSGTIWNSFYAGGNPFTTPAFNFEGSASSFSNNELATIQRIWARTAEAFSPFEVNVTTQDPGVAALSKTTNDTQWGVRVVIGGSSMQWYGAQVGGIAFIGSFNMNNDTPVFVFPTQLGGGSSDKNIAGAAIHEAGHALGLQHHGTTTQEYYAGHGSGETGWAPIMGNPYSKNLNHWSKGEYANANRPNQDDLAIITGQNGFGYRADDYWEPRIPTFRGDVIEASGIIETRTDTDTFGFLAESTFLIVVSPASVGGMLDVGFELLDRDFGVLATVNPSNSLSATLTFSPVSNTSVERQFYLRIDGTGNGAAYSDYGSIGQWNATITQHKAAPPIDRIRARDWFFFSYLGGHDEY